MFLRLLFLMTMIPIAEIYFLLRLSDIIGGSETIMIIIGTGILGAWLLRSQGASILQQVQNSASQNQIPSDAISRGFFTFIGGVLLLTPGLITDALGMSLIFPLTQSLWKKYFTSQWQSGMNSGKIHVVSHRGGFGNMGGFPGGPQPGENQQTSQRRFDPNVIDIDATKTQTVEKKDEN